MFQHDDYRVRFRHSRLENPETSMFCKHPLAHAITVCFITKDDVEIGQGESACSRRDNFSRSIGRKISMARALADAKFDRDQRCGFWKAYFDRLGISYD